MFQALLIEHRFREFGTHTGATDEAILSTKWAAWVGRETRFLVRSVTPWWSPLCRRPAAAADGEIRQRQSNWPSAAKALSMRRISA